MPCPDPGGIQIEEYDNGGFRVTAEIWWHGNRRHRLARMKALTRRLRCGGWKCRACGEPVPLYRRADADYCCEGCRKAHARARRRGRGAH